MVLPPPVLSALDLRDKSEGSVDPFGTQAGYERLAERILPFITVRMSRPRFLTAMCVGAHVCAELSDELAADGITPAWLVFEWYVVEAHVRLGERFERRDQTGFPGWTKVRQARREGRALGNAAYLKTPTIFGFGGIYRRLATGLQVLTDDMLLDEGGNELLRIWEREQGLSGFVSGQSGVGSRLRGDLRKGVEVGLEKGHTDRPGYWSGWKAIPQHLAPSRAGRAEARWLFERLCRADLQANPHDPDAQQMRAEMIDLLRRSNRIESWNDERPLIRKYLRSPRASRRMRERLDCIDAYEGLCRCLEDGLRLVLFCSTRAGGAPVRLEEVARHPVARGLPRRLADAGARVARTPVLLEREPWLSDVLQRYRGLSTAKRVLAECLEQHVEAQRNKPPDGKRPWFDEIGGDRYVARPQFGITAEPTGEDEYVHEYRLRSLTQFLTDLRRVRA